MQNTKLWKKIWISLVLFFALCVWTSFAVELNSTNITQAPFSCPTSATICNLYSKNITGIATNTFVNHTNLTNLRLDQNQINSIENWDFNWLDSLTYLDLTVNQITNIESGAFNWLPSLAELHLYSNQITSIENGDFNWLNSLTYLDLVFNQISSIESGDFNGIPNLQGLALYSNPISSIENWDFNWLQNVINLWLDINQISSIDITAFDVMASLSNFYITNGCNSDPINNISILNQSTDWNNCVIIDGSNYTSELTSKWYTLNGDTYEWNKTISFYKNNWNTIVTNTNMLYVNANGYTQPYYTNTETKVFYPAWTVLTKGWQNFTGNLTAPALFNTWSVSQYFTDVYGVMRFGNLLWTVDFSQNVTVTMPAFGLSSWDTIDIYTSNQESVYGQVSNPRTLHQSAVPVIDIWGDSYVQFTTNHASRYAVGNWITAPWNLTQRIEILDGDNRNPTVWFAPGIYKTRFVFNNELSSSSKLSSQIYDAIFLPFYKKDTAQANEQYTWIPVNLVTYKTL